MHIFITGICGFAGSSLARQLRELIPGSVISGMDSLARAGSEINRRKLADDGIRVIHGDVRCASDFESLPKVDWVIDAAAQPSVLAGVDGKSSPRQLLEHNLLGTLNILEYCRRVRAGFILLSTSRVYSIDALKDLWWKGCHPEPEPTGSGDELWDPEAPLPDVSPVEFSHPGIREDFSNAAPLSLYGSSKLASENLALEYNNAFHIPVWINRCGVLAGAGQFGTAEQGIFSYWIHAWQQRRPLRYIGFGGAGVQVRDALHPADLARLIRAQIQDEPTIWTRVYNAAGGVGNSISLAALSDWCRERFGPHTVAADESERPYDVPWLVLDCGRAEKMWQWTPQRTLPSILEEIAQHAEANPGWLDLTGG